jgi:uncharacterized protein YlxW (UPF0749 family)
MNQFEMVVLIVGIVMFATVLKARYAPHRRSRSCGINDEQPDTGEAARLREEVKMLKERIHVLERITTDRENSLSREIEELRDH